MQQLQRLVLPSQLPRSIVERLQEEPDTLPVHRCRDASLCIQMMQHVLRAWSIPSGSIFCRSTLCKALKLLTCQHYTRTTVRCINTIAGGLISLACRKNFPISSCATRSKQAHDRHFTEINTLSSLCDNLRTQILCLMYSVNPVTPVF